MKRILVILGMAVFCLGLGAAVTATFSPSELQVNKLSTFTFDPVSPQGQPILTHLTVTNLGATEKVIVQLVLKWNSNELIKPGEAVYISRQPLPTGQSLVLSNRDLVSEQGGIRLEPAPGSSVNIDIMDVIENFPTLEGAVLSGYFPDGELLLETSVKAVSAANWENTSVFRIKVRNAGAIYPISPGKVIGQVAPSVKDIPVSFLWNSINTGFDFNQQQIVIKEFPPNSPPSFSTVAQTGVEIYRRAADSGFSDYIPFSDKYYYAWQVYTPIIDQTNIPAPDKAAPLGKSLASEWFVFRYLAEDMDAPNPEDVQAMLNILGNSYLIHLLNMGYAPTGEVLLDGRRYTGQDAVDILASLAGKEIHVELRD